MKIFQYIITQYIGMDWQIRSSVVIDIAVNYKILFLIKSCNLYSKGTGPQAFSMICCALVVISNNQ